MVFLLLGVALAIARLRLVRVASGQGLTRPDVRIGRSYRALPFPRPGRAARRGGPAA